MGKRIKALVAAAVVLLIFLTGTVSADDSGSGYVAFSVESTEIRDGAFTMTVYAELSGGLSIGGIDVSLGYDTDVFTAETVSAGADFRTADIQSRLFYRDIRMLWDSVTPYSGLKAELLTVTFTVSPEAKEGAHEFYLMCKDLYDGTTAMGDIPNNGDQSPLATSVWVGDRLAITPSDMTLIIGQTGTLDVNKEVNEWFSTAPGIVTVDESGTVRALSVGTAVIVVIGRSGEETAHATIRVIDRSIISVSINTMPGKTVYIQGDILDLSGLTLTVLYDNGDRETVSGSFASQYDFSSAGTKQVRVGYGGVYTAFDVTVNAKTPTVPDTITSGKFTVSNGYLSKIPMGTTVDSLVSGITEKPYIKVFDNSSRQITAGNAATGMAVKLMDGNIVKQTVTLVVTGDVNGDGAVSITDMINVKSQILHKSDLTGCYKAAADTNGDGGVSITDFIQIKAHILKKSSITAR